MIRTRVAPSPTGDPHLGTAFVALMNMLYARQLGGSFILRIEDTDKARSTAASEKAILESLSWLGITWDEGPDIGGPAGPYRQSDRLDIYTRHATDLLNTGKAFRCFCTSEDLDTMRDAQRAAHMPPRYDGRCAHLTDKEIDANLAAGKPFVVRMHIPDTGTCTFTDGLRGDVSIDWKEIDAQILVKSDGWPTYHLANVVDDHLMGITDVIRGEEWIPSTPKHLALYDAFGWDAPRFHHLPLLRNPDRSKLSKRRNPTSITHYDRMGYLPQALATFLTSFAVRNLDDADLLSWDKVVDHFKLTNLSLHGPVFDVSKLDWLQGMMVRSLDAETFYAEVKSFIGKDRVKDALALAQSRIVTLSDVLPLATFLFSGALPLCKEALLDCKLTDTQLARALVLVSHGLETIDWSDSAIDAVFRKTSVLENIPFKAMLKPFYVLVSGSPTSLPLFQSIALLGKDMMRVRLATARALLPLVSKKDSEALITAWNTAA